MHTRKSYRIFQIDAFTDVLFKGNPAAVVPWSGEWLPDKILIQIAAENNLAETAFFRPRALPGEYDLRWFTPKVEVDLCGHATLATAYSIFECGADQEGQDFVSQIDTLRFFTKSGIMQVRQKGEMLYLDFPSYKTQEMQISDLMLDCFESRPREVLESRSAVFIFKDETELRNLKPNFEAIKNIPFPSIIATAPADSKNEYDFVSRYFAPAKGIPEDPVTGSAHCTLIPLWSKRLGKSKLLAFQASERGGLLICEDLGERVSIGGSCAFYLKGEFYL
ncbi:isomerase [Leptospira perolatii]|uniref:Isomerase n=1 Tax=Leptospira perolatii TaxID=2023191 RepID=A0A2M9ZR12_9LEPT|nr:PhzF family phenazine biosynthesis protein [Leptospira perolatii]PJZ70970.1 isomerase [Leptospira perolatii]PJZ74502.1 isomerase [Leptospira perolatii]